MSKAIDGNRFYRPELDALRFFAFICVFFFHYLDYASVSAIAHPIVHAILTADAFGVPVFFLLSSFLIVELLLRELKKTGSINIKSFYTRRILRIWPLYYAVLFSLIIVRQFIPIVPANKLSAWLAFIFFSGNWYVFKYGWIGGPVDPLWSISIEEQFYAAIPLLTKLGGRKLLTALSIILILVSCLLAIYYAKLRYTGESGEWVNSFFQFQFFSAGALLAICLNGHIPKLPMFIRFTLFVAALLCWFFPVYSLRVQSYDTHPTVLGAIFGWSMVLAGAAMFFIAAYGTPRQFVPRILVYLGRISFGLYMFHNLVFHLVFYQCRPYWEKAIHIFRPSHFYIQTIGGLLSFAFTVGLASISYRYLERPFLKLKEKFTIVRSRLE